MNLDEIRAYFSGDRITCMRCGKSYGRLGGHLQTIHQMSENEYRDLYGLPWTYGLTGTIARQRYSEAVKKNIEAGLMPQIGQGLPPGAWQQQRPRQPYRYEVGRQNLAEGEPPQPIFGVAHFEAVLARVAEGQLVRDALGALDMAGTTWRHFLQRNPDLRAVLMRAIDALPFSIQAANHMGMGPRFFAEVSRLRELGLGDRQIAERLGVTTMTVNRNRLRAGGALAEKLPGAVGGRPRTSPELATPPKAFRAEVPNPAPGASQPAPQTRRKPPSR
jgi:hypothetical protein